MSASGQYQTAGVRWRIPVYFQQLRCHVDIHRHISNLDSRSDVGVRTISNGDGAHGTVGLMYISSNYGATWTSTATSQNWYGVSMSASGQYQTAVVYGGYIYISSNYGVTWTQQTVTSKYWWAVTMSASGQYQTAVVYNGFLYTSSNYGVTWTQQTATSQYWYAVAVSASGQYQTAVIQNGFIYTSLTPTAPWQ
jgi:hypothetical protein